MRGDWCATVLAAVVDHCARCAIFNYAAHEHLPLHSNELQLCSYWSKICVFSPPKMFYCKQILHRLLRRSHPSLKNMIHTEAGTAASMGRVILCTAATATTKATLAAAQQYTRIGLTDINSQFNSHFMPFSPTYKQPIEFLFYFIFLPLFNKQQTNNPHTFMFLKVVTNWLWSLCYCTFTSWLSAFWGARTSFTGTA